MAKRQPQAYFQSDYLIATATPKKKSQPNPASRTTSILLLTLASAATAAVSFISYFHFMHIPAFENDNCLFNKHILTGRILLLRLLTRMKIKYSLNMALSVGWSADNSTSELFQSEKASAELYNISV